jgi:hypothetical protein
LARDDPISDRVSAVGQPKLLDHTAEAVDDTVFRILLPKRPIAQRRDFFYTANGVGEALQRPRSSASAHSARSA